MNTDTLSVTSDEIFIPVESEILGHLTVPRDDCVTFPEGILGFPACQRFILVATSRPELYWLQSVDHGSLAFLLVDPFTVVEGFSVDLSETDLATLEPCEPGDIGVLAIVTLPGVPEDPATANLQGLLAVNFVRRLGRQVVISESNYDIRWPIDVQKLRMAS
jgi:flagellar assembly factor FliW